ncbi:MAG: helix-turn-helix domain-containing protein [Nitrososphaerales archaeon]|jgi:DNA-binding transcriptional ArsR family regulator
MLSFNQDLALAVVGQALVDEGSILTDKIEVFYNDERTARYLFEIAKSLDLAHSFRSKMALRQKKYGFTIHYAGWAKLYKAIGPLPDTRKDLAFRFLLRVHPRGPINVAGESKKRISESLYQGPRAVRELCYAVGLSGSTMSRHLSELARQGQVKVIGKNVGSKSGKNKAAFVWSLVPISIQSSMHKCEADQPQTAPG